MWDLNSPTRDQTHVPCLERWFLNHWTAREVPQLGLEKWKKEAEDKPVSEGCCGRKAHERHREGSAGSSSQEGTGPILL